MAKSTVRPGLGDACLATALNGVECSTHTTREICEFFFALHVALVLLLSCVLSVFLFFLFSPFWPRPYEPHETSLVIDPATLKAAPGPPFSRGQAHLEREGEREREREQARDRVTERQSGPEVGPKTRSCNGDPEAPTQQTQGYTSRPKTLLKRAAAADRWWALLARTKCLALWRPAKARRIYEQINTCQQILA